MVYTRLGRSCRVAAGVLALVATLHAEGLRLQVVDGSGLVVAANATSSRRITVSATDDAGRPLAGVTVHFRLPASGPSGTFASGMVTESAMTSAEGRVTVYGIHWNAQAGRAVIRVTANSQTDKAELEIPIEISATQAAERETSSVARRMPTRHLNKRWLYGLAGLAAGAAVAIVAARPSSPGSPDSGTPVNPPPVSPTIGTPVVVIGAPVK